MSTLRLRSRDVVAEGTACNPALACRSHVEHSYLLSSSGCRLDLDAQQAHGPPPVHSADFRRFHRNAPRPAAAACLLRLVVSVELGWFAAALLLVVLGIVGSVVPLMPGLPLVLGGVYLYAFGTGLHGGIGPGHLVLYTLIGGGAIALSTLANMVGCARGQRLAAGYARSDTRPGGRAVPGRTRRTACGSVCWRGGLRVAGRSRLSASAPQRRWGRGWFARRSNRRVRGGDRPQRLVCRLSGEGLTPPLQRAGRRRHRRCTERPHPRLRLETPEPTPRAVEGAVRSRPVLGSLHHVYERAA